MPRSRAACELIYGSCPTIRISNGRALFTTSRPMLPSPTMPSVLPRSSLPRNFFFSHLPAFVELLACGTALAIESINARVCSATETALPPGVFITSTPASVAAGRSTLSTPTPARPITLNLGAAANTSLSTLTALRTTKRFAVVQVLLVSLGIGDHHFPVFLRTQKFHSRGRERLSNNDLHYFFSSVRVPASAALHPRKRSEPPSRRRQSAPDIRWLPE